MWGGIQSLGLIFYSEHVHSPLHLSVPSNNSSVLAACLPASLVNHAVFASDLAKIVAGLYIYMQLGCRKGQKQSSAFWLSLLQSLSFISALTHSHFFPLSSLSTSFSSAVLSILNISLSSLTGKSLTLPQQRVSVRTHTQKRTHTESLLPSNSAMRQMQAYQSS